MKGTPAGLGATRGSLRASLVLTFSPGGLLFLQDDPLPVQAGYGGAEVQGLLLSTLEAEIVQGVTHLGRKFLEQLCVVQLLTDISCPPRSCHLGRASSGRSAGTQPTRRGLTWGRRHAPDMGTTDSEQRPAFRDAGGLRDVRVQGCRPAPRGTRPEWGEGERSLNPADASVHRPHVLNMVSTLHTAPRLDEVSVKTRLPGPRTWLEGR